MACHSIDRGPEYDHISSPTKPNTLGQPYIFMPKFISENTGLVQFTLFSVAIKKKKSGLGLTKTKGLISLVQ